MADYKTIAQSFLPDSEKERLCMSLLEEFGVGKVRVTNKGEIQHGCLLPNGQHSDQERNPTGSLNYKRLTYHCFGCGQSGGLFWYIGVMRGCSATQARKWLAKETGTDGEVQGLSKLLEIFDAIYTKESGGAPMPKMAASILDPWLVVHPYMTDVRKIPEDTMWKFRVGYGVFPWGPPEDCVMSKRIVLPHFWQGSLVGWQTRRVYSDPTPKYLSSPDFPRDSTLYNYDANRDFGIIVEAPMSVLRHYHQTPELEATFGASLADKQKAAVRKHKRVVLFFDNGKAGEQAVLGTYDTRGKLVNVGLGDYLSAYSHVDVVFNPYVQYDDEGNTLFLDPADLDDKTYGSLIEDAVPYSVWHPPTKHDYEEYKA